MSSRESEIRVVCVTPMKNEAWILERFLAAAQLWADHIVLADQASTDASREIAARFPKVRLVENTAPAYDEGARQRLLLAEARDIPGPRAIVALDADEALAFGAWDTAEWRQALAAPPGTTFAFDWINVLPDLRSAYVPRDPVPFAFIDDGRAHVGSTIHSTRVPIRDESELRRLTDVKILHLQYTDALRVQSKQRWYQAWERLNHPEKRPVQIYRQYNRLRAFPADEVRQLDRTWLAGYEQLGVDLTDHPRGGPYWWDLEVVGWLIEEGVERFRRIDLWDVDWPAVAGAAGRSVAPERLADPRSAFDRAVHRWLARTQRRAEAPVVRWMQRALVPFGW